MTSATSVVFRRLSPCVETLQDYLKSRPVNRTLGWQTWATLWQASFSRRRCEVYSPTGITSSAFQIMARTISRPSVAWSRPLNAPSVPSAGCAAAPKPARLIVTPDGLVISIADGTIDVER